MNNLNLTEDLQAEINARKERERTRKQLYRSSQSSEKKEEVKNVDKLSHRKKKITYLKKNMKLG